MRHPLPKASAIALLALLVGGSLAGTGAAVAEEACFPHCDYVHYYGPYDFTYDRPGLFGYPQQCGPQGDCTPYLAYTTGSIVRRRIPVGRITVRFPRFMAPRQQE